MTIMRFPGLQKISRSSMTAFVSVLCFLALFMAETACVELNELPDGDSTAITDDSTAIPNDDS